MNKKIIIFLMMALFSTIVSAKSTSLYNISNPDLIMQYINTHSVIIYLLTFFALGLLLSFTPCVLPMVPILSGIIVGQKSPNPTKAFLLSLAYVLGMAITYALAGMLAGYLGSTVQTLMQKPIIIVFFALIFISMALSMIGYYDIKMPEFISRNINLSSTKQSYLAVGLMGVLSTLIASPCVTAPLIGVLTFISQTGKAALGGMILFVMALGMGLPLLLVGSGFGKFLPKSGQWMITIKAVFGYMMFAIALYLLARILPSTLVLILSGILIAAMIMNLFNFKYKNLVAVTVAISSVVMFHNETIQPNSLKTTNFIQVSSLDALKTQLAKSKKDHKPAFVEFYASWCSDCKAMDSAVFNQQSVQLALEPYSKIKVDISENSDQSKELKQAYKIYGTPTLLLFSKDGKKLDSLTSVGYTNAKKLKEMLTKGNS